jgi:hypothetical protein
VIGCPPSRNHCVYHSTHKSADSKTKTTDKIPATTHLEREPPLQIVVARLSNCCIEIVSPMVSPLSEVSGYETIYEKQKVCPRIG